MQVTLNGAVTQSVGYDALGNITSRSDVGSYTYHPTRKHARNAGPGSLATRYITRDHLGSVDAVLSSTAEVINRESFNVWGSRRSATGWTGAPSGAEWAAIADTLRQGYTSDSTNHTHLDNLGLIHMNGRVLDPTLGRFISADPSIPDPYSSQSWNRYSYVRNNYLSRIDRTGFEDEYVEEIFVTDTPIECQQWGVGYSGCPDPCVANPFGRGCPDLIHRNPYLQPGEPRDDDPAAAQVQSQKEQQCFRQPDNRSFGEKAADFTVGFGDAFLIPIIVRGLAGIEGTVDYDSAAFGAGKIAGIIEGLVPMALQGTAAYSAAAAARGAPSVLNANRYFRIGPGVGWGGTNVPRISSPFLPGDGHFSLTSRLPLIPPFGALFSGGGGCSGGN